MRSTFTPPFFGGGIMDLSDLQTMVYMEYVKNDYKFEWERVTPRSIGYVAELGLITTEVTEAIECVRKGKDRHELADELADIIIRTLNFASRFGLQLEPYIVSKHKENMERPRLHGTKEFKK